MIYRTHGKKDILSEDFNEQKATVRVMQVKAEKFHYLCELYPTTCQKLKDLALIKREIVLYYMDQGLKLFQKLRSTGIPSSL